MSTAEKVTKIFEMANTSELLPERIPFSVDEFKMRVTSESEEVLDRIYAVLLQEQNLIDIV